MSYHYRDLYYTQCYVQININQTNDVSEIFLNLKKKVFLVDPG